MWEALVWVAGVWVTVFAATFLFLMGYALVKAWEIARQVRSFREQLAQLPTTADR